MSWPNYQWVNSIHGSMRIAGDVIWARPLIERHRKESAGKGGGGQTVVSYSSFATFAVTFARGAIGAIRKVWADGRLLVAPRRQRRRARPVAMTSASVSTTHPPRISA